MAYKQSPWDESLNTRHISSNLQNYEAARSAFFVFYIHAEQLKNLYKINTNKDGDSPEVYDKNKAAESLRLNVVKASVPSFTLQTLDYRRGNNVVHAAGTPEFTTGSIVVDDVVGLDTKSLLYSWLYLAYDPKTRRGGRMAEYKKEAVLMEYTQDYELLRTWKLHGCFITGIDEGEFDRENDSKRQLTVNFIFDDAEMEVVEKEDRFDVATGKNQGTSTTQNTAQ